MHFPLSVLSQSFCLISSGSQSKISDNVGGLHSRDLFLIVLEATSKIKVPPVQVL